MVLKYLLPFDRVVINSPYRIDEARNRLREVTVNRQYFRLWWTVPGTFEGEIHPDRFTVLTSAEGFRLFDWEAHRNAARPVCNGHMTPSPGGCRIEVHLRPMAWVMIVPAIWLALVANIFLTTWDGTLSEETLRGLPGFAGMFAVILLISYAVYLRFFWEMRRRAVGALKRILT